jgi:hypothetical protein
MVDHGNENGIFDENINFLLEDIADRIDKGALIYKKEVPIDKQDDPNRDNEYEAYEELCDALVYLSAHLLRKENRSTKNRNRRLDKIFYDILLSTLQLIEEIK